MARTPEQFRLTDASGEKLYIADDVNGSATGVVNELILAPAWLPKEHRESQSTHPVRAAQKIHRGRGGRQITFTLTVVREFDTVANMLAFKAQHAAAIGSLGQFTLLYSFGSIQAESTGCFTDVNAIAQCGVRITFEYQWLGTGFTSA